MFWSAAKSAVWFAAQRPGCSTPASIIVNPAPGIIVPVRVEGLGGPATEVTAGGWFSCVLLEGGTVECWGRNNTGQLGDASTTDSLLPVEVVGLPGPVAAIDAGYMTVCAVLESGRVMCWGLNHNGTLGDGSDDDTSVPVEVTGIVDAIDVGVGRYHACAQTGTGELWCWGSNIYYQAIPSAVATVYYAEVRFESDEDVDLSLGDDFSCAWMPDADQVLCWGKNSAGQVGAADPSSEVIVQSPVVSVCP